jgi:hypothetical protein
MTMYVTWIASFKEETRFSNHIPFQPKVVFCDGQIHLMRGCTQKITSQRAFIIYGALRLI